MSANNPLNGITMALGNATLSLPTTTITTLAIPVAINGKAYTCAANTGAAITTTDGNTGVAVLPVPDNKACVFVVCSNTSGADIIVQSEIVSLVDDTTGYKAGPAQFPEIPDLLCPIAYFTVKNISGADFILGTTSSVASGITTTITSVVALPARPDSV